MNKIFKVCKLLWKQSKKFTARDIEGWCYRCNRMHKVYGFVYHTGPNGTTIHISGVSCTAWSTMGSMKFWLDETLITFCAWLFERILAQEDLRKGKNNRKSCACMPKQYLILAHALTAVFLNPDM